MRSYVIISYPYIAAYFISNYKDWQLDTEYEPISVCILFTMRNRCRVNKFIMHVYSLSRNCFIKYSQYVM